MSGKQILRAYGTGLLSIVSALLTNLWLLRAIAKEVEPGVFGLYAFVLQIAGYLAILQLGLDMAVSRQVAESLGRGDQDDACRAYQELVRFNRLATWVCLGLTFSVAAILWAKDHGGSDHADVSAWLALLTGTAQALSFRTRSPTGALIGSQFLSLVNLTGVGRTISTTVLAYLLLRTGWGILCLPAAEVVTQAGAWLILSHLRRAYCPWSSDVPPDGARPLKPMLRYGLLTTIGGLGWTIEATSDVFILQALWGSDTVAAYVLWWRFPQLAFTFSTNLAASAFPGFAARCAVSPSEGTCLLGKVGYLSLALGSLSLVGIGAWLPAFVHYWLRGDYDLPSGKEVALFMGLLVCLRTVGNLLAMFWLATGRAQLTTTMCWIQAVVKIALAISLANAYGIVGLVVASCIASLIQAIGVGVFLWRERLLRISLVGLAIALTGTALTSAYFLGNFLERPPVPALIGGMLLTTIAWGMVCLVLAWFGELRPLLVRWLGPRAVRM